ncbi:sulfatase [Actinomadura sp. PM05-2]|uniref:Sulfatase n=2 Tax=Actinomadura parmotrematis TaxID=2864039 RepID=A0ABS7G4H8_9ACTN|nr:sulfatase [Actinomadura parmotrematis]
MTVPMLLVGFDSDVPAAPSPPPARPNIVLVLADDLDRADLARFPQISALRRSGASFDNAIVTDSWCCPSRSTILRSQYVHSHGVKTNNPPDGGWPVFRRRGLEASTVGTWLHSAGYRTGLIGKYLNGYPGPSVPPGWDDWRVPTPRHMYAQRDFVLIENGKPCPYKKGHLDDVLTWKADAFIRSTPAGKPFFLYLAPLAPHLPAPYAPRHAGAFAGVRAPRTASFDRASSGDARWLARRPPLGRAQTARIDRVYRDRLRSTLSVDDMIGSLTRTLAATGRLNDTYLFFASDNGFHLGQHRLAPGKTTAFDEDVRVPLIVRGPGIVPGATIPSLAGTVDLAPTFADLAGAGVPSFAEGRSLVPLLRGGPPTPWRTGMLVEFFAGHVKKRPEGPDCDTRTRHGCPLPPTYAAIRTSRYTYVEYSTGERRLYDRLTDPAEMRPRTPTGVLARTMHAWLARYRSCKAESCRRADQR